MYLKPGNLYKDFTIEKKGASVTSRGRAKRIRHRSSRSNQSRTGGGKTPGEGKMAAASAPNKSHHSPERQAQGNFRRPPNLWRENVFHSGDRRTGSLGTLDNLLRRGAVR